MDITVIRDKLLVFGKKYRYVLLILIAGVVLMLFPTRKEEKSEPVVPPTIQQNSQLEVTADRLEAVLTQIKGAGKVKVLLTYAAGGRTVYQTNERSTSSDNSDTLENETVIVSDSSRSDGALVAQILAPEYLGAVVVCQGAENPTVRLAVSEAVAKATGLGTDRISVLKMK